MCFLRAASFRVCKVLPRDPREPRRTDARPRTAARTAAHERSRLGPKDSNGNPYGGNLKVIGRAEILFPVPEKWRSSARISAFFDMGNVFSTGGVNFTGKDGVTPVDYKFKFSELRQSAGFAVQWLAPLGIFRFSFGFPLNKKRGDAVHFADETEGFQFTVGSAF